MQSDYVVMPDGNIIPANKTGAPMRYYPVPKLDPLPIEVQDIVNKKPVIETIPSLSKKEIIKVCDAILTLY